MEVEFLECLLKLVFVETIEALGRRFADWAYASLLPTGTDSSSRYRSVKEGCSLDFAGHWWDPCPSRFMEVDVC